MIDNDKLNIKSNNVKNQYLNNTKICNKLCKLYDMDINSGVKFTIESIVNNKYVINNIDLTPKNNNIILSNTNITSYDKAIMDTVYTLIQHNTWLFTAKLIAKILYGKDVKLTEERLNIIQDSLTKLSQIMIKLDCTQEMRERYPNKNIKEWIYESYLLPIETTTITLTNGISAKGYRFIDKEGGMALYNYAEELHQIIRIENSNRLFNIYGIINNEENILLIRYIITRIELMKNTNNHIKSNYIKYDYVDNNAKKGLINELGYDKTNYKDWNKKFIKIRKLVRKILDYYVAIDYIRGFNELISPITNKIDKIEIIL